MKTGNAAQKITEDLAVNPWNPSIMARPVVRLRTLYLVFSFILLAVQAGATGFSFVHISDTHITASGRFRENLAAVAAEVDAMSPQPAFVIVTGDETEVGLPAEMEQYKAAISGFQMPVYSVPGNHETKWSNWGKTSLGRFFGQNAPYSFDYGNIHFVGLDSSVWMQHHGLIDRSELEWLKRDLEKAGRSTPSILFYHHCPGFIPDEPELLRAVRPYNVRLILVGHGHTFKTWKKNGLLFQETKGVMNDSGGCRVFHVSDSNIKSYTKLTGKDRVLDATIPLASEPNPVTILRPWRGERVESSVHIRAVVQPELGRTVECGLDDKFQPVSPDSDGVCDITVPSDAVPGWHTVTVRAKDPDGMEWTDSSLVRINGGSREAWRFEASGGVQRRVRAYEDRLYFGTLGGGVYCLDARTGKQLWRYKAGSDAVTEVAVSDGLAFCGVADGRIQALDAETGDPKWEYQTGGPVMGSPLVSDGNVYIGSGEPAFYALDAETGRLLWKHDMDRMTQVVPLRIGDTICFGAWDKYFYALNASDGSVRWRTLIGINFYFSTADSDPATDGKRIAVNVTPYKPEDPDIYCLDVAKGDILWKIHNPGKSACGFTSPSVVGERLYCTAGNGDLFSLRLTDGRTIWRSSLGMTVVDSKPIVKDGRIYVTGLRGSVSCADARDGKKLWTYSTGEGYQFAPATVWSDLLIVPSTDGSVTALSLEQSP